MRWRALSLNQMGLILTIRPCVKKTSLALQFFLSLVIISINRLLLFFASLFIYTPILLFFSLSTSCVLVCVMVALLSTLCAFRVCGVFFFMSTSLAQVVYLKFCPGATLDPCSQQGKKKHSIKNSIDIVFFFYGNAQSNQKHIHKYAPCSAEAKPGCFFSMIEVITEADKKNRIS